MSSVHLKIMQDLILQAHAQKITKNWKVQKP